MQSEKLISRPISIKNFVPEFELSTEKALQLLKPLYGLSESGDLWFEILDAHHRKELGMKTLRCDPALYTLKQGGKLIVLSGTYVDDIIRAGDPSFRTLAKETNDKFEMADEEELPCEFTGFKIDRDDQGLLLSLIHI